MSESLWNDIDERLKSQLNTYMGAGSAFATLKLRSVEASILTDPQTWGDREFPFAIVDGRIEEMNLREHGTDLFDANGESRFKYFITCVVTGTRVSATRDAKILDARVRNFLFAQMNTIQTVVDSAGGHPVELIPTKATVAIYPVIGSENEYYGISMRAFDVIAHMEG